MRHLLTSAVTLLALGQDLSAQTAAREFRPSFVIGSENGPEHEAFAYVGDVDVTSNRDILILDRLGPRVAWFTNTGSYVGDIGRRGSGPGEFREPYRMAIDGSNRVHVYDMRRRQISVYALDSRPARHVSDQPLTELRGPITDLCAIGSRRFIVTPYDSLIVAELDPSGKIVRRFGAKERPDPAISRRLGSRQNALTGYVNSALAACDPRTGMLVLVSEHTPVVRAFSSDGRPLWRTVLADFVAREIHVDLSDRSAIGFRLTIDPRTRVVHAPTAVTFVGDLVYITLYVYSNGQLVERTEGRILAARDGMERGRRVIRGRLAWTDNNYSVAFVQYPFAQILAYSASAFWTN